MNEKFTKGKWVSDGGYAVIVEGSGGYVGWPPVDGAICSLSDGEYIENNNNYDAYLIAAAPEMYEMLKECQREIEFLINEVNRHRTTNHSRYEDTPPDLYDQESLYLISKLLAKARGEL